MSYTALVTTYNEELLLPLCLSAIEKQTVKPSHLVIVDDGSTDRTRWFLDTYVDVVTVKEPKHREGYMNRARAFNRGLEKTRPFGDGFLLKVDADISIPENYAETLLHRMDPSVGVASGVSSGYANKRWVSNGAIMYRMDPLREAPMKYAWDRAVALGILRQGYDYRVVEGLVYAEMRPPRFKAPPLMRVIRNRLELASVKLVERIKFYTLVDK